MNELFQLHDALARIRNIIEITLADNDYFSEIDENITICENALDNHIEKMLYQK